MGATVMKWAFVSVCTLCILLAGFSRIGASGRKTEPEHEIGGFMRVKLMHRNHRDSPFRDPSETRLESLRSHFRQDKLRLAAFSTALEKSESPEGAEAPENGDAEAPTGPEVSVQAPIFSGSFVGSGQYFVDVHIGTPAKRFLLIADTGSDLLWVNCRFHSKSHWRGSSDAARAFDSGSSSTFSPVSCAAEECLLVPAPPSAPCNPRRPTSCKYMYKYSDRSDSSGVFAYETLTMNASASSGAGMRIPKVAMGCSTRRHGHSFHGADGVIGLGQGPISFSSQIAHMYGDKFSYCLVDHLNSASTSSNYLVFGNHHNTNLPPLQYTPIQRNPAAADTFYYVGIQGLNINRIRVPIPETVWLVDHRGNRGSIVDSGTTLSYVLEPGYGILLAAFEQLVCYPRLHLDPFDLCFNTSGISKLRLPEFSVDFDGGASFRPPVDNYFIDAAPDVKCLGILGSSAPFGQNVIGNIMQQNFFVEFDRRNSRLGFAGTDCSKD